MERVLIIGCPGAGKSTAARRLAAITHLPVIHLDRHYWLPGWKPPGSEAWRATIAELAARPRWIMDGNYGGTLATRLQSADTVIVLDFPTLLCLSRVTMRTLATLGRERGDDGAPGCFERFDWPFFRFVLNYRRTHRQRDMAKLERFAGAIHRLTSPAQLDALLPRLATTQR